MKALGILVGEYLHALGADPGATAPRDQHDSVVRAVQDWLRCAPPLYANGVRLYLVVLGCLPRSWWKQLPCMGAIDKLLRTLTYLSWNGQ